MSTTYAFKTGDKRVPISGSIPLDLTGGAAFFVKKNRVDDTVSRFTASIHNPIEGGVSYSLTESDLTLGGRFYYEWEGQDAGGRRLTEPSIGYFELNIYSDLR